MIKNITSGLCALSLAVIATAIAPSAEAQTINLSLNGNTSYDKWETAALTANANNKPGEPNFPGFGNAAAWPRTIASNLGGDAELDKVDGTGNPASGSIYFGGTGSIPNDPKGTLVVRDNTPLANLKTVVFQLQIGEATGYDLYDDPVNGADPVLYYTTGGNRIALEGPAFSFTLINQVDNGIFEAPTGPEPLYLNTWAFQWDLSGVTTPITLLEIEFTGVEHAQLYSLQLDQSDFAYQNNVAAIPEPSTWSLLFVVGVGTVVLLRRKPRLA
ncbi:MAG TPA: PEP-CTERM sorting domain-containing protein [Chthoniobacteraceae bacterium]|nr:PEP-CTERM sorting domain-containing protein [Chthoniobacteraceae bacterium]